MSDDQSQVIVTRIKVLLPDVSLDDDVLAIYANDAITQATADEIPETQLALAASLYAAHLVTIATNKNNNISKEQVSTLSREYFDRAGGSDYLSEYKRLVASYKRSTINFL